MSSTRCIFEGDLNEALRFREDRLDASPWERTFSLVSQRETLGNQFFSNRLLLYHLRQQNRGADSDQIEILKNTTNTVANGTRKYQADVVLKIS